MYSGITAGRTQLGEHYHTASVCRQPQCSNGDIFHHVGDCSDYDIVAFSFRSCASL